MDLEDPKKCSVFVSSVTDYVGYNYEIVKFRQDIHSEFDTLYNRHGSRNHTRVTTGGKGEGTTLVYENDFDYMFVGKDVICAENPEDFSHQESITLLKIQRKDTSPGYTTLELVKLNDKPTTEYNTDFNTKWIQQALVKSKNNRSYLSSQLFTDCFKTAQEPFRTHDRYESENTSGPSSPAVDQYMSYDIVASYKCVCPDIIDNWVSRPRNQGWPSKEIMRETAALDGHVVPVGFKGSEHMDMEWRICYSLAELFLMRSLSEGQIKVYILLKKLIKSAVHPICKDMTSYIMKNVVLWICEQYGDTKFGKEEILPRLFDCIKFLQKCLGNHCLPSYMITERNLLAGRLDSQQRHTLISLMNDLLTEGTKMVLRIDKIHEAVNMMNKTPDILRERSETRDKVEKALYKMEKIMDEIETPEQCREVTNKQALKKKEYWDLGEYIEHLIKFDKPALTKMGITGKELDHRWQLKLHELLS